MKKNKIIGIIVAVAVLLVGGYFGYQIMNGASTTVEQVQVEPMTIHKPDTTVILNGTVATPETKAYTYDYATYGELWNTHVYVGQFVEKDQLIVESGKKDYKAPFAGFITSLNVDAAYNQAKRAYDDKEFIEMPETLYTIASSDYYIQTTVTEYEITRLPQNKKITFEVRAAANEQVHTGWVRELSGLPNIVAGSDISTYNLTINMPEEAKYAVRLGNHVTVRIADENEEPLIIPATSILELDGKTYVYIIEGESELAKIATKREVIIEQQADGQVRVIEGLLDGEQIAKTNVDQIIEGAFITIASPDTTATNESTTE